jgi:hypothetical protein
MPIYSILYPLLGSVPFHLLLASYSGSIADPALRFLSALKVLRLARLGQLARLMKLGKMQEELEEKFNLSPALFEMLTMLLQVCAVGHVVCCVLWGVSTLMSNDPWYGDQDLVYRYVT